MTREVRGELFFKIKHKDSKNHWASMFFTISTDGTLCGWNSEKEFEKGAFPTEIIDFSPYKLTTTTQTTSVKGNELSGFALEWKDVTFYFVTHESLRQRWVDAISAIQKAQKASAQTSTPEDRIKKQEQAAVARGGKAPSAKRRQATGQLSRFDTTLRLEAGMELSRLRTEVAEAANAQHKAEAKAESERAEKEASKKEKEKALSEKARAEEEARAKDLEAAAAKEDAARAKAELQALRAEADKAKAEAKAAREAIESSLPDERKKAEQDAAKKGAAEEKALREAEKAKFEAEKAKAEAETARAEAKIAQIEAQRAADQAAAFARVGSSAPPAGAAPSAAPRAAPAFHAAPSANAYPEPSDLSSRSTASGALTADQRRAAAEARRQKREQEDLARERAAADAQRRKEALAAGGLGVLDLAEYFEETSAEKAARLEAEEKVRKMMKGK